MTKGRRRARAARVRAERRRGTPGTLPVDPNRLRQPLLRWYRKHRRDLPWRETKDPYRIWVAEVMLQQTRVAYVRPFFERFVARLPTLESLAAAPIDEVLGLWSGLGYYRRAHALHRSAQILVERNGGRLPHEPAALRELPGIGRSTAGAIASTAFGIAAPVLDGNVQRVLTRWFCLEGAGPAGAPPTSDLWRLAATLVPATRPGDWNQALMELGARVCTAARPACASCPVSADCRALAEAKVRALPRRRPRRPTERVVVAVAALMHAGRVLLERPPERGPLRGAWDLPACEVPAGLGARAALGAALGRRHGLRVQVGDPLGHVTHAIMHRKLRLELFDCRGARPAKTGDEALRWLSRGQLGRAPISAASRKLLRLVWPVAGAQGSWGARSSPSPNSARIPAPRSKPAR